MVIKNKVTGKQDASVHKLALSSVQNGPNLLPNKNKGITEEFILCSITCLGYVSGQDINC